MSACSCVVRLLVSSCLVAQLLACSDSAEIIAVDQSSSMTKSSRAEVGAEVGELSETTLPPECLSEILDITLLPP